MYVLKLILRKQKNRKVRIKPLHNNLRINFDLENVMYLNCSLDKKEKVKVILKDIRKIYATKF